MWFGVDEASARLARPCRMGPVITTLVTSVAGVASAQDNGAMSQELVRLDTLVSVTDWSAISNPDPDLHVCVEWLADSAFHWLFQEEAFRQERRSDGFDVFGRYAASAEVVPPSPDGSNDGVDFLLGSLGGQPEALAPGKQVVDARRAAIGPDRHREIAAREAYQRRGDEIVSRRQLQRSR